MKIVATIETDQCYLAIYIASRLKALDKKPGASPIGVNEILSESIGRSIIACNKFPPGHIRWNQ